MSKSCGYCTLHKAFGDKRNANFVGILGQRSCFGRRYMPMLQCYEGASWTICVRYRPEKIRMRWYLTCSYSKWFLEALGHEGLNNMLAGFEDKSAQAVCTFAYCEGPGHEPLIFQGRTDVCLSLLVLCVLVLTLFKGKIVPARGPSNFGEISQR